MPLCHHQRGPYTLHMHPQHIHHSSHHSHHSHHSHSLPNPSKACSRVRHTHLGGRCLCQHLRSHGPGHNHSQDYPRHHSPGSGDGESARVDLPALPFLSALPFHLT